MEESRFQNKIINATKWSSITEIAVKLVSPITNMVLARILAPEAFGVVATTTMIVSFAQMFTDAGFQKYLIQHEFENEETKYKNANVAFWTNLVISISLWMIIVIFRESIAYAVGNPGMGNVVSVASFQLILTSFSSIQMALYRRNFDFKTLFLVRLVSVFIPFIVTLPLAYLGLSYWSLIIGTTTVQFSNAVILTIKSKWKPSLFYSKKILKEMFSFSIWSLVEAISIWLTTWADTFIIGSFLNQYYLGLYKTSTSMVNSLLAIVTGATTPILFSTLARLQNDDAKFNNIFLKFQRLVSMIVFPLGVGVFLYRDLATQLLLGEQWSEASDVIGIWALTGSIMIVFSNYCSELYRAKGKPKLSFIAQLLHLVVLIPACLISAKYGFWVLIYTRTLIRLQLVLVHFIIMKFIIGFPVFKIFKSVSPIALSAISMGVLGYWLQQVHSGLIWSLCSILICVLFYTMLLLLFPNVRNEMLKVIKNLFTSSLSKSNRNF